MLFLPQSHVFPISGYMDSLGWRNLSHAINAYGWCSFPAPGLLVHAFFRPQHEHLYDTGNARIWVGRVRTFRCGFGCPVPSATGKDPPKELGHPVGEYREVLQTSLRPLRGDGSSCYVGSHQSQLYRHRRDSEAQHCTLPQDIFSFPR